MLRVREPRSIEEKGLLGSLLRGHRDYELELASSSSGKAERLLHKHYGQFL
jgi:hypothetical protein